MGTSNGPGAVFAGKMQPMSSSGKSTTFDEWHSCATPQAVPTSNIHQLLVIRTVLHIAYGSANQNPYD